jgi:mannonate dehydratase
MPPLLRVARTSYETPIRGGALSSEFRSGYDGAPWDDSLRTADGETSHEAMRANFKYFLEQVGASGQCVRRTRTRVP